MTEEEIMDWMRQRVNDHGFSDATTLAEEFLHAHKISDALDPEFSRSLDAGFKIAQEIRDHSMVTACV